MGVAQCCRGLEGRGVFIFGVQEVDSIWLVCGVIDVWCVCGVIDVCGVIEVCVCVV